jgi:tetratricopeptide (TPR) repeat protein
VFAAADPIRLAQAHMTRADILALDGKKQEGATLAKQSHSELVKATGATAEGITISASRAVSRLLYATDFASAKAIGDAYLRDEQVAAISEPRQRLSIAIDRIQLLFRSGELMKAQAAAHQLEPQLINFFGEESPANVDLQTFLGFIELDLAQYAEAQKRFERILQTDQRQRPNEPFVLATKNAYVAIAAANAGNIVAEVFATEAMQLAVRSQRPISINVREAQMYIFISRRQFKEALAQVADVQSILRPDKNTPASVDWAKWELRRANILRLMGELSAAAHAAGTSLSLLNDKYPSVHPDLLRAELTNFLSSPYNRSAHDVALRLQSDIKRVFGENHSAVCEVDRVLDAARFTKSCAHLPYVY